MDSNETPTKQQIGAVHGFYSERGAESVAEMRECTLFLDDGDLLVGDMGEFQVLGGLPELLPDPVAGVVRTVFADDDAETLDRETARTRRDSERYGLDEITEIEVETGLPPGSKQRVELDHARRGELSVFVGTADEYGGEDETQAFVDALSSAAEDAGGAPRVTSEYDV